MAVFKMSKVEYRKVPGFGGKYEVGSDGSVRRDGSRLVVVNGYVTLSDGGLRKRARVCYLVARAFVQNPECRPWVRHVDGNPRNDAAGNLEWCERKEELRGRKLSEGRGGPVTVWKKDGGDLVGGWPSLRDACRELGVSEDAARKVLRGVSASAKGYVFKIA